MKTNVKLKLIKRTDVDYCFLTDIVFKNTPPTYPSVHHLNDNGTLKKYCLTHTLSPSRGSVPINPNIDINAGHLLLVMECTLYSFV